MAQSTSGSFRIGQVAGIDVYVHWTWLLLGYFEIMHRSRVGPFAYERYGWNALEFLSLFGIVLLHEFGHALACRSVGGRADRVVLWLLGGAAMVSPPPRPGAWLWSIAAGPFVNLVLAPILFGCYFTAALTLGHDDDRTRFLLVVTSLDVLLLVFNLLPIYPLDGGQILHALLWFVIGRVNSLYVVSSIGLLAGMACVALAVFQLQDIWFLLIAGFVVLQCLAGFQQARQLSRMLNAPRHEDAHCPACGESPFRGHFWVCDHCHTRFDTFENQGACPGCGEQFATAMCPSCYERSPVADWYETIEIREQQPGELET